MGYKIKSLITGQFVDILMSLKIYYCFSRGLKKYSDQNETK